MPLLNPFDPSDPLPLDDAAAAPPEGTPTGKQLERETDELLKRLTKLSDALHSEGKRSLLVVLQGRDGSGKDGAIRRVFGAVNPQGLQLASFSAPAGEETRHDFLWRIHRRAPETGTVGVFNRSHYEEVLAVRVRNLKPREVWERHYTQINDFERMLSENGVTIIKFLLNISKGEQKERLLKRLNRPEKRWKLQPSDLEDRALWDDYTAAFRDMLARCSTPHAPWFVVPADEKHVRDLLIAQVVVDTLERMAPRIPEADPRVLEMADRIV
jgi:PPK2 family polyphosphate:nucleotide phosphotransferase